ncbi:uncharacterized protein LOC119100676 [Pollicipes pollicipes]|uniref:uncharacterized protein LOC119100676 n=1 Tax=Pollicipes pollicipes TaxID=41117 RepID=UPI00188597E9|nr:uncharacterized protein LOC119100676 [Pollicipes pollicipes]
MDSLLADVRLSVVRLAESVLTRCAGTLPNCASPLLQLLILVSCDSVPAVRQAAEAALRQVQARAMSKSLVEAVEEDFYALTARLPAVMRSHNVPASLVQLSLLEGYLHLLGPRVRQLTASAAHVRLLLSCLTQLVELRTDAALVPYVTSCGPTGAPHRMPDFKRFRHFDEPEVWQRVCSACRLLGCHGDLLTLLELLETDGSADEDRVVWNQLLLGQEPALLATRGVAPQHDLLQQLDLEPLLLLIEPTQPAELARVDAEEPPEDAAEGFRRHRAAAEDAEPETTAQEPAEEVKPQVPLHVRLVRDVVQQSVHFLDCDVITVQVDVLATLAAGSRLLAAWQDELLPLAVLRTSRDNETLSLHANARIVWQAVDGADADVECL